MIPVKTNDLFPPSARWQPHETILERDGCTYVIGLWDNEPCIAFRCAIAVWIILDRDLVPAAIDMAIVHHTAAGASKSSLRDFKSRIRSFFRLTQGLLRPIRRP
jgi:hypothetical protein